MVTCKDNNLNLMQNIKIWWTIKREWPFRYAERFSGTSLFCLLFLAMQKSKCRSRHERQSQSISTNFKYQRA